MCREGAEGLDGEEESRERERDALVVLEVGGRLLDLPVLAEGGGLGLEQGQGVRGDPAVVPDRLGPLKMPPETNTLDGELADARWFHVDYLASRISPERARPDPRSVE